MIHIPIIRHGKPYRSLDTRRIFHPVSGELLAELSLANPGLVRLDATVDENIAKSIRMLSTEELITKIREAGRLFLSEELKIGPLGPNTDFEAYVDLTSATTGLPKQICRGHGQRLHNALINIKKTIETLSHGLSPKNLDALFGSDAKQIANSVGIVLPSNAPGVNGLWLPFVAFKTPIAIKPGHADPWTPLRLISAFIKAGIPAETFSFYPSDHAGGRALLLAKDAGMIFGNDQTTAPYEKTPTVQRNGAGYSKVIFGADTSEAAQEYLPFLEECVVYNGGRSCTNTSTIIVNSGAKALAKSLAKQLMKLQPRPLDDEDAILAGYADPAVPESIANTLEKALKTPGAKDVSRELRGSPMTQQAFGHTFLLPTVIHCEDRNHPLAQTEYPFPMVTIIECQEADVEPWLGNSLAVSVISKSEDLLRDLKNSPKISSLHQGPVPTTFNRWQSPHIGNIFDLLHLRPPGASQ